MYISKKALRKMTKEELEDFLQFARTIRFLAVVSTFALVGLIIAQIGMGNIFVAIILIIICMAVAVYITPKLLE